jgi:tRNA modification GTPase
MGIQRARGKAAEADLVLLLFDLSQPLAAEDLELYGAVQGRPVILVANKHDLMPGQASLEALTTAFPGEVLVVLSATTLAGLTDLEEAIYVKVAGAPAERPGPSHWCAPNARHRAALVKALACIEQAGHGLSTSLAPDLLAVDVQEGLDCLAEIVGQTTTEDVLDRIFSRFCIGK